MSTTNLQIGDTVYIPAEDPKCNTIYTVEKISPRQIKLYHPIKGERVASQQEIADSIY